MEEIWEGKRETGKREMLSKHILSYWGVMGCIVPPTLKLLCCSPNFQYLRNDTVIEDSTFEKVIKIK